MYSHLSLLPGDSWDPDVVLRTLQSYLEDILFFYDLNKDEDGSFLSLGSLQVLTEICVHMVLGMGEVCLRAQDQVAACFSHFLRKI